LFKKSPLQLISHRKTISFIKSVVYDACLCAIYVFFLEGVSFPSQATVKLYMAVRNTAFSLVTWLFSSSVGQYVVAKAFKKVYTD
jgi:hypothetical protein